MHPDRASDSSDGLAWAVDWRFGHPYAVAMAGSDRRTILRLGGGAVLVAAAAFGLWSRIGDSGSSGAGARPEIAETREDGRIARTPGAGAAGASAEASGSPLSDPPAAGARTRDEAWLEDGVEASLSDEQARPTRAFMRHAFESAVAESFPDRRLSSDEIELVTDSLMTLRDAKQTLRELPPDEEHAEQRRLLVEQIGEASSVFRHVMDISPSEFTAGAGPGVDRHDVDEVIPEAEFLDRAR